MDNNPKHTIKLIRDTLKSEKFQIIGYVSHLISGCNQPERHLLKTKTKSTKSQEQTKAHSWGKGLAQHPKRAFFCVQGFHKLMVIVIACKRNKLNSIETLNIRGCFVTPLEHVLKALIYMSALVNG